ncbi:NAD(P)H-dependent oxidoreductase [Actinocrinis puniceicyclus]|uniref:FMN dependent NADH:quinone oxidoreductase n=1 Tax=Actinocrinis puniceicyclus TaxID=977794 RepID=A0A8J8BBR7_9ACTN|nr:NAD(P)H-dependent oxidoreductase [Actinocrinis puniceicyclus]MBS2964342.1 NAD(P)H-dependent oxidoreductase [Actinocrinis puniceicyclus]
MAHLLHVDSSALSAGSVSKQIAATFREAWAQAHPEGVVTHRDLGVDPVPPIAEAGIMAAFVPPAQHSPEQVAAYALRTELVDEVLAADAFLFTVPMYNWGVPGTFKVWLDQIIQSDRTMTFDGNPPLGGRPATVILAYGGGYDPGAPRAGWDFVQPYLETVLGEALGFDLNVIKVQLTLAERNPAMAQLIPAAKQLREAAHSAAQAGARALAERFSAA